MNAEDIGEMVETLRIQYLKLNQEAFCRELKITNSLLHNVENGKGPHGVILLKKIRKKWPHIKIGLTVKIS